MKMMNKGLLIILVFMLIGCGFPSPDPVVYERVFNRCVDKSEQYFKDRKMKHWQWENMLTKCGDEARKIARSASKNPSEYVSIEKIERESKYD